jgi:hypothetical protein
VLAISISLAVLTLLILAALIACLVRNRAKKPQEPPDTAEVRHTLICPPAPVQEPVYSQKAGQPLPPPPTPVQWSLVYGVAGGSGQAATYTDSSHYEGNNTYEVPRVEQQLQYSQQQQQSPAGLSYARSHTAGSGGYPSAAYSGQQQTLPAASHSPHSYGGSRQSGHSPSYHSGYGGSGGGAYRHVDIY